MFALAMEFGWRRVPAAGGGGGTGPAPVVLGAAIACGAIAALAQLDAVTGSEQPETTALVGRMTVAPSPARRTSIDQLIAGLKADGIWGKLDWLAVTAAHDAQAARLNWRAAKALAAVNAPVFTVDRGYAGDGASAWLDLGEGFGATGNQFVQDAASIGVWANAGVTAGYLAGTASTLNLFLRSAGATSATARLNASVTQTATVASGYLGHFAVSRAGSGTQRFHYNGGTGTDAAATSTAVATVNGALLRAGSSYGTGRIAALHSGAPLSDAEMAALRGRLNTYLTAMGAQ